jgi:anti-sigma regulatory factor (Ser/Thr protein kinase)
MRTSSDADGRLGPSSSRSWPLAADVGAPGEARHLLARHCAEQDHELDDDTLGTAQLLVSELVTNAVRHGEPPLFMRIDGTAQRLRVEVTDEGEAAPGRVEEADAWAEQGRGLMLVDALATEWGCAPVPGGGKVVWFELARG